MNIGIDGNEANIERRVGVGEYAFQLIKTFYNNHKNHNYTVFLKQKPLSHMPDSIKNWKYAIIGPKVLWTQIALPLRLIREKNLNLIFSPSHYGPRFSSIPSVISIMDLSYIHYPELFKKSDLIQLNNWTKYSVKNAKRILTISNFSKKAIVEYYKVDKNKVFVTYPGYKKDLFHTNYRSSEISKIKKKYSLNKYLLFVGTIQPRKNLLRLLQAFNRVKSSPDLKLVLVGKKGWLYEEIFEKIKEFKSTVLYLDYLDDISIAKLYRGAQAFILPSLYEGFGITVIEAMASGCPVIISNNSSLPEVGGKSAIYIDPTSVESIVEGILKVLEMSSSNRENIVKQGLTHLKNFSWDSCASKTIDVFENIV